MVKLSLLIVEIIDLLVKMLFLRYICMYRVDNIFILDIFCLFFIVLCYGNF